MRLRSGNECQSRKNILDSISKAKDQGAKILCGGKKYINGHLDKGFYIEPTLISGLDYDADIVVDEIFGPMGHTSYC